MGKTSKEKALAKIASMAPMIAESIPKPRPRTNGSIEVRWEKKIVDGETKLVYTLNSWEPYKMSEKPRLPQEYTDVEVFKKAVCEKIDAFNKKD